MADTNYKVTLPWNFPYAQRIRAGVTVTKAYGYEGPLTDEQVTEITEDGQFVIELIEAATQDEQVTKPLTKAELLAQAETDGLKLDVTKDNTRDEIVAAIEAATKN
ncbi:hypothetical protein Q0F99_19175 [Rathayibacter oskolensis]|uniref:hypothetical protein n=1 Tax=Rathayibacter oskolensis TaxID=1891671 RepID=UPI00265EAB37|nr:hypothetical protein [Rathayibacter oskolensis]WKK71463.1 hypothetical protein Q0F99_19175 [Rathayibacter oskolensis]